MIEDQYKLLKNKASVSYYKFFNAIVDGLMRDISNTIPEVAAQKTGLELNSNGGSVAITANVVCSNDAEVEALKQKTKKYMDALSLPSDLVNLIDDDI